MVKEIFKYSYVTKDGIIKETVFQEEKCDKEWEEKWGFTKNFEKLCLEVAAKRGISEETYKKMTKMKYRDGSVSTITGSLSTGNETKEKTGMRELNPSGPVPKTTSGLIGWRATEKENNLEKYPMYVSPRLTIRSPDEEPIHCIILG